MKQQLARTHRVYVPPIALLVGRDVHAENDGFAISILQKRLLQTGAAIPIDLTWSP